MQRELASFPIPPSHRNKLQEAGFSVAKDVIELKPSELSEETGLTLDESLDVIRLVKGETEKTFNPTSKRYSALEALQNEREQVSIVTFSEAFDEMLGGGVPLGKITEICGVPGIGKTQISLQLCVDVQIPEPLGGVGGEAVYIDTEGSFVVERLVDIARATLEHCQQGASSVAVSYEEAKVVSALTIETFLAGVHYYRVHNHTQLIALSHLLPDFIKEHSKVRLIVVDSIAFHFRYGVDDYALRNRLLSGLAQSMSSLATSHHLAVVFTNQMTTRINTPETGTGSSHLVPALGESWGHVCTIRVILFWKNRKRHALLYKSPSRRESTVAFQITTGGIRDVTSHDVQSRGETSVDQRSGEEITQPI